MDFWRDSKVSWSIVSCLLLYYEIDYFGNICKGHADEILNCEPGVQTAKVPVRNRIIFYEPVAETFVSHPQKQR